MSETKTSTSGRRATTAVHAGEKPGEYGGAAHTPIFQNTVFSVESGTDYHNVVYPRLNNTPNHQTAGEKVAALESAEAGLVTASGMAAISAAVLAYVRPGDEVVAHHSLYGGTYTFFVDNLKRMDVTVRFVDLCNVQELEGAIGPNSRLIYSESITNPLLRVPDHEGTVAIARKHGIVTVIDNTIASPEVFRPAERGFDLVVHSASKYLNGHSDVVAGAVVGAADKVAKVKHELDHLGGSLDMHACYLLNRGMKTLPLRMAQHTRNAAELAQRLSEHANVTRVNHPSLGDHEDHARATTLFGAECGMLSFEVAGGAEGAKRVLNNTRLAFSGPSLGGVESLITIPAQTSHSGMDPEARRAAGIGDGLIRYSVGVEDVDDLWADLEAALGALA